MKHTMAKRTLAPLAALLLAMAACAAARAGCSRPITAPVAPIGVSVTTGGGEVGGIYPELLRSLGARGGCELLFSAVPRARQELMFENGQADLLIPATRTPARDRLGLFIPMIGHRATLISLAGPRAPVASAAELLERRELRVAVVRGFDFGPAYGAMLKELEHQGRLFTEVDVTAVARLLQAGATDLTIMGPTTLAGTIAREPRLNGMLERLRIEPIAELPWGVSGAYLSRTALSEADRRVLRELLERAARGGAVLEGFQRHHRADLLKDSVRPR